ncbi:hypothetical protein D3C77_747960 [compost metagenome]
MLADVGVDVLGRLLAADAEALHQVARGQAAFPPGDRFDQAVAQGEVPADVAERLFPFHGGGSVRKLYMPMSACSTCRRTLHIFGA